MIRSAAEKFRRLSCAEVIVFIIAFLFLLSFGSYSPKKRQYHFFEVNLIHNVFFCFVIIFYEQTAQYKTIIWQHLDTI